MSAAPKLSFVEATETSITVKFSPASSSTAYTLQWKTHEQGWDSAKSTKLNAGDQKGEASDLEPGTTYYLRLTTGAGGAADAAGPELVVDTEQVGCTPGQKSGCCIIS